MSPLRHPQPRDQPHGRRTAGPRARPALLPLATGLALAGLLALAAFGPAVALAIDPTEADPLKIMTAVEARDAGDRMTARMQMTVADAAGLARVRVVQTRALKVPGGRKQLMIFESPADVRNTGLLAMDWDDGNKDDDQWLYLPSLHKVTRIASGDRAGAFMGSDLSYADMTKKDPKLYSYAMIKPSAPVGGEDCWLIEARPKTPKEQRETGYVKTLVWISKTRLLPLQTKAWVAEGKKIKLIKLDRVELIDGVQMPRRTLVRTMRGATVESTTTLELLAVKIGDASVKPTDFEQRRLEQGL